MYDNQFNLSVLEATDDDVLEYFYFRKQEGNNVARQRRVMSSISAFYKFLRKKKLIKESPTEFLERPKQGQPVVKQTFLNVEQVEKLREKLNEYGDIQLQAYIFFGLSIDIRELTNRLQKTTIRGKKNKPLFFNNITEEIKNNYPPEVYKAYVDKEHYAKLDIRHCGVNRFCNMNRKYGLTPVFKALKPNLMLDTFDETDKINAKAKAKKIIHQILRKEVMGNEGNRKALEEMAYAHEMLSDTL